MILTARAYIYEDVAKYRKPPNETKPKALLPDGCNYITETKGNRMESIDNYDMIMDSYGMCFANQGARC